MEKKTDFKSLSAKAKIEYIWDYYRWHIIITVGVIIAVTSTIHYYAAYQENVMNIVIVNAADPQQEAALGLDEFYELAGLNPADGEIYIDTSLVYSLDADDAMYYYNEQTLLVRFAAGDMDVFIAPQQVFERYADNGYLADLSTLLSEEDVAKYADLFAYGTDLDTNTSIPCGIILEDNSWLTENHYYDGTCCIGITANTESPELALEFLQYIME